MNRVEAVRGWPRLTGRVRPPQDCGSVYGVLGYVERDGLQEMFSAIFDQVLAYAGGKPINVVNPEALKG